MADFMGQEDPFGLQNASSMTVIDMWNFVIIISLTLIK